MSGSDARILSESTVTIKKSLKFLMVDSKDLLKENMMSNFFMWDIFPENKPKK